MHDDDGTIDGTDPTASHDPRGTGAASAAQGSPTEAGRPRDEAGARAELSWAATRYEFPVVPGDHPLRARYNDLDLHHVALEQRGPDSWAVKRGYGPEVLNRGGGWEYEPSPSNRTDVFLARCRFTLVDAAARLEGVRAAELAALEARVARHDTTTADRPGTPR